MEKPPRPRKPAEDLRYWLALMLGIAPEGTRATSIVVVPMNDSWRALSGRHDDDPEFRSAVIRSIELAEKYDLES